MLRCDKLFCEAASGTMSRYRGGEREAMVQASQAAVKRIRGAGYAAPAAGLVRAAELGEHRAMQFAAAIMGVCLFLQRFALPLPGKSISVVGPIGMGLAIFGLVRGELAFNRGRLIAFLVLTTLAVLGMAWQLTHPNAYGAAQNLQSLAQFLLLTSFATLSFAQPVEERRFFRMVNFYLALIAGAGVLQFVLQFVGIRVFQFTGLLPSKILYETGYNLQIPVGFGGMFKANGFFLVEPSVFSQFMAVALIVEMLYFKRLQFLGLFLAGLVLSFSGTGWIVLAAFVLFVTVSLGTRGLVVAVSTVLLLALVIGVALLAAPHLSAVFQERMAEFSRPGTSAQLRFATPFWLLHDVLTRVPSAAYIGIGSGASERLTLPYVYDVNTPVKVALEYGFPALIAYVLLFILGPKTRLQRAIVLPGIVLFLFTGGYQQFPPVLFPVLLLLSTAWLRPGGTAS